MGGFAAPQGFTATKVVAPYDGALAYTFAGAPTWGIGADSGGIYIKVGGGTEIEVGGGIFSGNGIFGLSQSNDDIYFRRTAAKTMSISSDFSGGPTFDVTMRIGTIDFQGADGAAASAGTLTNAPSAGDPSEWIPVKFNGNVRYIPAWD